MNEILEIITSKLDLRQPVPKSKLTKQEAEETAALLFTNLNAHLGLGLSANQIGLRKRMCVVNVKEPIYLLNPVIVDASKEGTPYSEGCLSIPSTMKKNVKTIRHMTLTVTADNYPEPLTFKPDVEFDETKNKYTWAGHEQYWNDKGLLECVCVQHEIDHLNGVLIIDRRINPPVVHDQTYGRNEKVMIENSETGETKFEKFKRIQNFLQDGWVIK